MSFSISLPDTMRRDAVRTVFAALEAKGGKGCVRFVGGCVRNVVMGHGTPTDLDLSTQLVPDDTEAALAAAGLKSVPTGKAFGTITAVVDGAPYEITSLREDVETDGRRAVVSYTDDWAKDAQRRDFYLNALYADIDGQVYDPTGFGLDDARQGRVRFIGEASQRIREDYLRILRFFRFSAGYAAEFDVASLEACVALKAGLDGLSAERIWGETHKTLNLIRPLRAFEAMLRGDVLPHIVPGWIGSGNGLPELAVMIAASDDPVLRLTALLDAGIDLSEARLATVQARMRFSNAVLERLVAVGAVMGPLGDAQTPDDLKRLIYRYGRVAVTDGIALAAAHAGRMPGEVLRHVEALEVPAFPLKGADLIRRGLKAGPEVGQRLKQIETDWVNSDFSQSVIDQSLDDIGK